MMKRLIYLLSLILVMTLCQPVIGQMPKETDPMAERATWWAQMFKGLKAAYNITVVVVSFDHVDEIHNVTAIEANGPFLVLRQRNSGNRDYIVVIHASSVLLIREGEA